MIRTLAPQLKVNYAIEAAASLHDGDTQTDQHKAVAKIEVFGSRQGHQSKDDPDHRPPSASPALHRRDQSQHEYGEEKYNENFGDQVIRKKE